MVSVQKISAKQTHQIRLDILRKGINLPVVFSGDLDPATFHLGVFEKNELKGIASFMKTDNVLFHKDQYQLRGMATVKEARGKGYGKLMILRAFELLRQKQVHVLWCNARAEAFGFYKRLGFLQEGNRFEIEQIGTHYTLFKMLV